MFELASQIKNYRKLYKAPAWQRIVQKKVLPGRSATSLSGTYRKFSCIGEEKALREILQKGRYSHYFQYPPKMAKEMVDDTTPSTNMSARTSKEISPLRADLLSDEEQSLNDEINQEEESMQEFLLAVDDLESVLSYRDSNERTYNLTTNIKKLDARNLSEAYTQLEEESNYEMTGHKRVKISEESENSFPIYDTNELHNHCEVKNRISLVYKNTDKVRYVSKALCKSKKIDLLKQLHDQLQYLSKIHAVKIEDLHMLFLEVSCDLERLKKVLNNDVAAVRSKWDELSDLAVQGNQESMEFKTICKDRGSKEVMKRRKFLERYESA